MAQRKHTRYPFLRLRRSQPRFGAQPELGSSLAVDLAFRHGREFLVGRLFFVERLLQQRHAVFAAELAVVLLF
jgi:hypothetical protein